MKFNYKKITSAVLSVALLGVATVLAKESVETIIAEYQNIQLVVDGVTVEPKDVQGNVVEPFIYNGTTYLPVRAVASAFGKQVDWDGTTSTVTLSTQTVKPDKEVKLWDRSYSYCSDPNYMRCYESNSFGYMYWQGYVSSRDCDKSVGSDRYLKDECFEYDLKGVAKNLTGEFYMEGNDKAEAVLKIYADGNQLYESPIMRTSTAPAKFDIPLDGRNTLKFVFELIGDKHGMGGEFYIKDATIVTSDYQD